MKNIHLFPTDKPSKLGKSVFDTSFHYNPNFYELEQKRVIPQNIYITSDEEIKEGDWVVKISSLYKGGGNVQKYSFIDSQFEDITFKKIILTTDQDLIKDGVQSIDDAFLEWFVKNPSCEFVKVEKLLLCTYCGGEHCDNLACRGWEDKPYYETIIPQEDPKQETLEEAAENYIKSKNPQWTPYHRKSFIDGAKWMQERMYSEEDVLKLLEEYGHDLTLADKLFEGTPKQWLEQFKKK